MKKEKKRYEAPSLDTIGQITSLTGMWRNANFLDNTNGSDAWRSVGTELELEEL